MLNCPLPVESDDRILLEHGSGGRLSAQLFESVLYPAFANEILGQRHDGARLPESAGALAFTTDTFVVSPAFFPGGNIGDLAVNGTVNDLAMCGARPLYLSCGLVIEEGFSISDLRRIVGSMRGAADRAGVKIVTGDTKVVERENGDGIFINTSGLGRILSDSPIGPSAIRPGDHIIINGDLGRHGVAILSVRQGLEFGSSIESDTRDLSGSVQALLAHGIEIHCLRDLTRGGLATTLVELAKSAQLMIEIEDDAIPVGDEVRGACEILGLDPLYVANEGRFAAFVPADQSSRALDILREATNGLIPQQIGSVRSASSGRVVRRTSLGIERIVDALIGEQLPRIC